MAHHAARPAYERLVNRLNKFPQGAPPSDLLYKILRILFSEREAELVALLPIKPFTVEKAARAWRMPEASAQKTLDELADRGILMDFVPDAGDITYVLPPPMAGFFEASMMRVRDDIDQKRLAELFYEYLNVEEDFIKDLFTRSRAQPGRAFVQEQALLADNALHVLDYERASEVIGTASHLGVGICFCRHKMHHLGRACDAPIEICMSLNSAAASLVRHGTARAASVEECLDLLGQAQDRNLVQFGENVQEGVGFICHCCACCCEALTAQRRLGFLNPIHTTNFMPIVDADRCVGCGQCVTVCPVEAMTLVSANDAKKPKEKKAKLDEKMCFGCGVCVRNCPQEAIRLEPRPERVITPVDSVHRTVVMALERGKLQNMIFDNQVALSHRALAAVLGAILRLPPVKRALAARQMKSRYLTRLLTRTRAP